MAYNNYLMKINGVVYPNAYMVVPSFKAPENPIEVLNYYDQTYAKHIEQAPAKDCAITFTIRQLKAADYADATSKFDGELSVEYYDVKTNSYKTGTYRRTSGFDASIWRIMNGEVWCNAENVKLERVG